MYTTTNKYIEACCHDGVNKTSITSVEARCKNDELPNDEIYDEINEVIESNLIDEIFTVTQNYKEKRFYQSALNEIGTEETLENPKKVIENNKRYFKIK